MMLRVTFELVHPVKYPQYYCSHGVHPATDPATIPDSAWHHVENTGEGILDQYRGLIGQVADGELIRNVQLWTAPDPEWRPTTPEELQEPS